FGFCMFVAMTVIMEFYKGGRAIALKNQMNLLRAMFELTHRNTRRYGGYLVHMGIVLMFIGFTGHAFNVNEVKEVAQGDLMRVGRYDLSVHKQEQVDYENYAWHGATNDVRQKGEQL